MVIVSGLSEEAAVFRTNYRQIIYKNYNHLR